MADCYVDATNGTAHPTGTGTSGNPYATIQDALDNFGSWSTTSGNTLYLANTAAFVLTSSIDFDTSVAKAEAPLVVTSWDNGGSLTATGPQGATISPAAEIDGNDAVASICDASTTNVTFYKIKAHSTTSTVLPLSTNSMVYCCEVYNGTETIGGLNNQVVGSYIHTDQTGIFGSVTDCRVIIGNEIEGGYRGAGANAGGVIALNYIHGQTDEAICIYADQNSIILNTIDGTGADSDATGINTLNNLTAYEHNIIVDNIISNWSGATAKGVDMPTGTPSAMIGNNAFYNNTTDTSVPTSGLDFTNITESSDPFTAVGSNDYSLVSGASSINASVLIGNGATQAHVGAWQDFSASGGGGGETTSVFMA